MKHDRVLFVIAHVLSWETAFETHRAHCELHPCVWLSSQPPPTSVQNLYIHDYTDECGLRLYHASSFSHMRGLAHLQHEMRASMKPSYDWYVLLDDNTRVLGTNWSAMSNRLQVNPRDEAVYAGDFADQGRSEFACGGGGFLLSHAAFHRVNLSECVESCSQQAHAQAVGLDHIMHRCMTGHNVRAIRKLSCGTCGNRWSPTFTETRVLSGACSFMHMQRSHSPRRYSNLLNAIPQNSYALLVHRYSEFH